MSSNSQIQHHDSPCEGDLEVHIHYRRVENTLELERAFRERDPSFQYIFTITTPPKAVVIPPITIATFGSKKRFVAEEGRFDSFPCRNIMSDSKTDIEIVRSNRLTSSHEALESEVGS